MFGSAAAALALSAAAHLSRTIRYFVDHSTGAEGAEFFGDTPGQYMAFINSEPAKWRKAIKASVAKVD